MNTASPPSGSFSSSQRIATALAQSSRQIRAAEERYGREQHSVTLLAVSKTKPVSAIQAAIAVGQRDFGENYLDEAMRKQVELNDSDCCWHYIGAIQSNKTAALARSFNWVHGIERTKIARRLSAQRPADMPTLNCCIQVNIDNEPNKAGISPTNLPTLCAEIQGLPHIRLRGLMVIPARRKDFDAQREIFAQVKALFEKQRQFTPELDTLSMGMSDDMEAAIAEGATIVRVGTAIFGAR